MTPSLFANIEAVVLSVDPPWAPRDQLPGERGAAHKYKTLSTDELCALVLPPRAERNVLIMWRLASMVRDALRVLDAWGYLDCSELVWNKLRPCQECCATGYVDVFRFGENTLLVPGLDRVCPICLGQRGTPYLGLGHYVRGAHEVAIIARPAKGRAPDRLDLGVPSSFSAPMLIDVDDLLGNGRGSLVHSAKPDRFFDIVAKMYPGPRVEMFSRRTRPGWTTAHSDEADKLDEVARIMRDVWPKREREERLVKARRRAK